MQRPILSAAIVPAAPTAMFDVARARLLFKRHDDTILNQVDWPLARLAAKGYDGACLTIGNVALRMLHAHPDVFTAHPGLAPTPLNVANTYTLAMELIQRSQQYETRRYVEAIDDLVTRLASEPDDERTSLPAQWPTIRRALLAYFD